VSSSREFPIEHIFLMLWAKQVQASLRDASLPAFVNRGLKPTATIIWSRRDLGPRGARPRRVPWACIHGSTGLIKQLKSHDWQTFPPR
jgi:hypothetical protein